MLAAVAAILALPASPAAAANPLAGATLSTVDYTLTIKTSRCPAGATDPTSPACGHLNLESTFKAGPRATVTRVVGQSRFKSGLKVTGSGRSTCSSESPSSDPQPPPEGSLILGTALHITNKQVPSTRILVSTSRRGARWAWPEPEKPAPPCDYFFGNGTVSYPQLPVTPYFPPSTLRKRRFDVTLESPGSDFKTTEPDGTVVYGKASWKLVLGYRRYAARRYPSFLRKLRSDVR